MSWFPVPETITTKVFTRLPDEYRRKQRNAWADANRGPVINDSFLEGPSSTATATSTSPTSRSAASSA